MKMQVASQIKRRGQAYQAAVTLIECLIYIALWAVLTSIGFSTYFQSMDSSKQLKKTSSWMISTLQTGERWREDVRRSTAPPQIKEVDGLQECVLTQGTNQIIYVRDHSSIWRMTESRIQPQLLLSNVISSVMREDPRKSVKAYGWELTVGQPKSKNSLGHPSYYFLAVPEARP